MGYENCGRKHLGWYRDLDDLLERSFKEVMAAFDRDDISQLEKAKIGAAFLVRRVGDKIDLSIEHTLNPMQLEDLKNHILAMRKDPIAIEYSAT